MATLAERELDIVVFGATGDTGCLGASWLYFYGKKLGIKKWAPAARNLEKLKTGVLDKLLPEPGNEGIMYSDPIKADSSDYASLVAMCQKTKLVLACAGPFDLYGEGVIRACCEVGTNYVDVTGEFFWVSRMENKYSEQALVKGITLVSMAGYDSVPSDLCTYLAADALTKAGDALGRFDLHYGLSGGAMPTGTIETNLIPLDSARSGCYSCCSCGLCGGAEEAPKPEADVEQTEAPQQQLMEKEHIPFVPKAEKENFAANAKANCSFCFYSSLGKQFSVPHFMSPINVYTVHRTAAQEGYGGMVYRERQNLGNSGLTCNGFLPMCCTSTCGCACGIWFLLCPCGTWVIRNCVFRNQPRSVQRVRDQMFSGCNSTGETLAEGYGISKNGKHKVEVSFLSKYDAGLGFTMLLSSLVASRIVQRAQTEDKPRLGFQTAVRALGAESLVEGFKLMDIEIEVKVSS